MARDDTTQIRSSGNVFADLGFPESEASLHRMRSETMTAAETKIGIFNTPSTIGAFLNALPHHVSGRRLGDTDD